jgi:hypothetical protein
MTERASIDVLSPPGGWGDPWPNVAEIEAALPHDKWTLVGGLMTQRTSNSDCVTRLQTPTGCQTVFVSMKERIRDRPGSRFQSS